MNNKKLDLDVLAWFAVLAVVLVTLFAVATWQDGNREWMQTQRAHIEYLEGLYEKQRLVAEAEGKPAPSQPMMDAVAIKQLMLTDLHRTDRCITCHVGIDDPKYADAPAPFTAHPDAELYTVKHPVDKVGCTSCHQGQGLATTTEAAHGFVHKWDYPMLGDRENLTRYVQASCAQCHQDPTKWVALGAPKLFRGRQIVQEKNCASCHKFGDEGGNIGPELTYEGDKVPEQFNFEHLKKSALEGVFGPEIQEEAKRGHLHHDVVTWHRLHFSNPQAVSSGSIMPAFGFSEQDLDALITYVLSLKKQTVPPGLVSNDAKVKEVAYVKPAEPAAAAPVHKGPVNGEEVYKANCASCHQGTGEGMPGMFPPLKGSEYTTQGDGSEHIKIVLKGLQGPIKVLGQTYNGQMPAFPQLSDEEIAAVVNHERTSWGNTGSKVTAEQVKALR
jgi:mono/diheme cytochrome c family protein